MKQQKLAAKLQVYVDQVSGKQPKLLTSDRKQLLKGYNQRQSQFYCALKYLHMSHPFAALRKHMPKYIGQLSLEEDPEIQLYQNKTHKCTHQWLSHLTARYKKRNEFNKFIVLENVTHDYVLPNILDIKIGGRNIIGKTHKITESVSKYYVKLNGCKINYTLDDKSIFMSKYFLHEAKSIDQILSFLALFFYDGRGLALQAISNIQRKLADMILCFKAVNGYKFVSSSLCLFYDAKNHSKGDIKFLDFGRVSDSPPDFFDKETCLGMQNVYMLLQLVLERSEILLVQLPKLKEFYSTTPIVIIPSHKRQTIKIESQQSEKGEITE